MISLFVESFVPILILFLCLFILDYVCEDPATLLLIGIIVWGISGVGIVLLTETAYKNIPYKETPIVYEVHDTLNLSQLFMNSGDNNSITFFDENGEGITIEYTEISLKKTNEKAYIEVYESKTADSIYWKGRTPRRKVIIYATE